MAAPTTKKHATFVNDFAAAAQSASQQPLDFTQGSVFLALAEASAGLGTWLQKLYIFALSVTRLVSSQGVWVDTFVNAFGMTRLPAAAATGLVQFSRYSNTSAVSIPVGAQVVTGDGTQVFQVYGDLTNGAFSSALNGYTLLAGANTVAVPVMALTAGTTGNVAAGTITSLRTPVSGIDAVINTAGLTNGQPQESDAAVKARFLLYIASLAQATRQAISYAVSSLGQNVSATFYEFQDPSGRSAPMSTVFVDDGSSNPPAALVQQAAVAVSNTKAFGVRVAVIGVTPLLASVQMTCQISPTYNQSAVVAAVQAALTVYINGLPPSSTLYFTRLEQVAYAASPGIYNVSNVTLNGTMSDLVPMPGQAIIVSNVAVTPAS